MNVGYIGLLWEIFWTLLIISFLIGLFTRILNIFNISILGETLQSTVCKKLDTWWEKSVRLLTYKPTGEITVTGFFCALLWPLFIFLNIFILAQIFEMFFPEGKRIPFPYVGKYLAFPLIMGTLYAIALTLFGILHGKSKSKGMKIVFVVIIAIGVIVEMGLAFYRAWIFSPDEDINLQTQWSTVIWRSGPILAAFLGFIVPIAETFSGREGFIKFIESLLSGFLHWIGGILSLFGTVVIWWIFGFSLLPPQVVNLKRNINRLRKNCLKLQDKEIARLRSKYQELKNEIEIINDTLREEIKYNEDFTKEKERFNKMLQEFETKFQEIMKEQKQDKNIILNRLLNNLNIEKSNILNVIEGMFNKGKLLIKKYKKASHVKLKGKKNVHRLENSITKAQTTYGIIQRKYNSLNASVKDIDAVLKGNHVETLSLKLINELQNLSTNIFNECTTIVNENMEKLTEIEGILGDISMNINRFQEGYTQMSTGTELSLKESKLVSIGVEEKVNELKQIYSKFKNLTMEISIIYEENIKSQKMQKMD